MKKERVYFSNHNFERGEWGEVLAGEKWVRRDGFIRRRYLFRNGDRSLVVFAPVSWASKFDENDKRVGELFPGEPRSHHAVWAYLAEFDPQILIDELGVETDAEGVVTERLVGEDSGPIGYMR